MQKIAVFAGSFDPITLGHVDIIQRSIPLFDKIIVAIGQNSRKKYFFPLEKRQLFIDTLFKAEPKVVVDTYEGLTVDYCKRMKANYLLRGIRSGIDFEYEKTIAQLNKSMNPTTETILLVSDPQYSYVSSTIVREILLNKGDVSKFLPSAVVELIR